MMAPVDTHVTESLPQRWRGETFMTRCQPDDEEYAQHTLTQVVTDVICYNREKKAYGQFSRAIKHIIDLLTT